MSFVPTAPKRMAALKAGVQEGSRMALYRMNNEAKNHLVNEKLVEKPSADTSSVLFSRAEVDRLSTLRRLDTDSRIPEAMMMRSPDKPTRKKPRRQGPDTGPTWGHLFGQIIIGVIEILIPLAFIVGMIYWRAPWLFWTIVHFLRGEPILNF
jgi:hypothetical protein